MKLAFFCLIFVVVFSSVGYADRQLKEHDNDINYDETKVPHYDLPPLTVTAEGMKVTTPEQWRTIRRPQVLSLFSNLVYGCVPVPEFPVKTEYEVVATDERFMDGKATRKEVRIQFSNENGKASIMIQVVTPNNTAKPVPAFMKLGSGPMDEALERGYGCVGVHQHDFVGHNEVSFENSIHRLFFKKGQSFPKAREWGVLAAIAWGHSRVLDYLEIDSDIDATRVAIMGHSKNGKAALWTAAQDERFALVISAQSGCGGAALWRRRSGETLQKMVTRFPYWLCPCGQNIGTARKFFDNLVLAAIPIAIFSRWGCSIEGRWRLRSGNFPVGAYSDRRIHDSLPWRTAITPRLDGSISANHRAALDIERCLCRNRFHPRVR